VRLAHFNRVAAARTDLAHAEDQAAAAHAARDAAAEDYQA